MTPQVPTSDGPQAAEVAYDNTMSGLVAAQVQEAIDEIASAGSGPAPLDFDVVAGTEAGNQIDFAIDVSEPGARALEFYVSQAADGAHVLDLISYNIDLQVGFGRGYLLRSESTSPRQNSLVGLTNALGGIDVRVAQYDADTNVLGLHLCVVDPATGLSRVLADFNLLAGS